MLWQRIEKRKQYGVYWVVGRSRLRDYQGVRVKVRWAHGIVGTAVVHVEIDRREGRGGMSETTEYERAYLVVDYCGERAQIVVRDGMEVCL